MAQDTASAESAYARLTPEKQRLVDSIIYANIKVDAATRRLLGPQAKQTHQDAWFIDQAVINHTTKSTDPASTARAEQQIETAREYLAKHPEVVATLSSQMGKEGETPQTIANYARYVAEAIEVDGDQYRPTKGLPQNTPADPKAR